ILVSINVCPSLTSMSSVSNDSRSSSLRSIPGKWGATVIGRAPACQRASTVESWCAPMNIVGGAGHRAGRVAVHLRASLGMQRFGGLDHLIEPVGASGYPRPIGADRLASWFAVGELRP